MSNAYAKRISAIDVAWVDTRVLTIQGGASESLVQSSLEDALVAYASALQISDTQTIWCCDLASLAKELRNPAGPALLASTRVVSPQELVLSIYADPARCDGWTLGLLLEAWVVACRARLDNEGTPSNTSLKSAHQTPAPNVAQDVRHWQDVLVHPVAQLDLPVDRPRNDRTGCESQRVRKMLDAPLGLAIKQYANRSGHSLFATLCAHWAALQARVSAVSDVILVMPVAGQMVDNCMDSAGQYLRHLPLAIHVDVNDSPSVLMQAIQTRVLDALDHANAGMDDVLQGQGVLGSSPSNPYPLARFSLEPDAQKIFKPLVEWRISVAIPARPFNLFELDIEIHPQGDALEIICQYNQAIFDASTVGRWLDLYLLSLERAASGPQALDWRMLLAPTPGDLALMTRWNQTGTTPALPHVLAHQYVEHWAALQPQATAVLSSNNAVTYFELNERANGVMGMLQSRGVKVGDRVAICLERGESFLVSVLGVLKSGAAYVPLDPAYPADRLQFMVADSKPVIAITDSNCRPAIVASQVPVLLLDSNDFSQSESLATNPDPAFQGLTPDHPAYVIYTSGSTGQPKGVVCVHRGLANLAAVQSRAFPVDGSSRVLQFASTSFDSSVWELSLAFFHGGTLCLASREAMTPGDALRQCLQTFQITHVTLPPSALAVLGSPVDLPHLQVVIAAGEACPPALAERWAGHCRFFNGYGPTENTVAATLYQCDELPRSTLPIGHPIANGKIYVLDEQQQLLPVGAKGEIYVAGAGLAQGYLHRESLTFERFVNVPTVEASNTRMYKTGDLGRWLSSGAVEFCGRNDLQVKLRGYRVELGEIESALTALPEVSYCAVMVREDTPGLQRLVAYLVANGQDRSTTPALREALLRALPDYMVPSHYIWLDALPVTPNGKIDRQVLPQPDRKRPESGTPYLRARTPMEQYACDAFAEVLELDMVGRNDNFFELGGTSLLVMRALDNLMQRSGHRLSAPTFFAHPTPAGLVEMLNGQQFEEPGSNTQGEAALTDPREAVAIIGMSGRFPGASDVDTLWANLLAGVDGITDFRDEDLDPSVSDAVRNDPCYVKARGVIEGIELFDAEFFGIPLREAEVMDPQHRVLLEIAWECMERAGYIPGEAGGRDVGVFAGISTPSYLRHHVLAHPDIVERVGDIHVTLGSDKDFATTRIAYKLGLNGPAVAISTACSTSLVAVAHAVDSLRLHRCRMALAGGAAVTSPSRSGYIFQEGAMLSDDGRTRTFDIQAKGTAFNDGAAMVLLKRLSDAQADGDHIYAVIRGVATNNDGGGKASFMAPSVDGQAAVIAAALADAGVNARSIGYVEAHGTATPLGDPVEIEALTRAYRRHTTDTAYCRIGSLKSNVGHLVSAAGATGLIKAALSLQDQVLPANLHYSEPNRHIDFVASPFVVNAQLTYWPKAEQPRRAGVSSFGVGGTNAHVVLEEAPLQQESSSSQGFQLLQFSARSKSALNAMAARMALYLRSEPGINMADVAHTLQVGRKQFQHRLAVVAATTDEAAESLVATDNVWRTQRSVDANGADLVWLFSGQGAQYAGMGKSLYVSDPDFRGAMDDALRAVQPHVSFDLREAAFEGDSARLANTDVTQPALFCLQYALMRMWQAKGVAPVGLIGHSVGEFAAAVLAEIMSLADAGKLVARRGALMQAQPAGGMLSVRLSAAQLQSQLPPGLALAASNGPLASVVAGPLDAIAEFRDTLEKQGVVARSLETSHAFHSSMMDAAALAFRAEVDGVTLRAPRIRIISTKTGTWLSDVQAMDPEYWADHLRATVQFSAALTQALKNGWRNFLEIGPRATLCTLARQHAPETVNAIASLGDTPETEERTVLLAQGQLWAVGLVVKAPAAHPSHNRKRIVLPTYPFEKKRVWLDAIANRGIAGKPVPIHLPLSSTESTPMATPPVPTQALPSSRISELVVQLRTLFEDVCGMDLAAAPLQTAFVELGLDSLTLTQAAAQLKKQFKVEVSFRQLMEKYRNLQALAEHLDTVLPPAAGKPAAVAMALDSLGQVHAGMPTGLPTMAYQPDANNGLVQQVIQQQMVLMAQQLDMLRGAGVLLAPTVSEKAHSVSPSPEKTSFNPVSASSQYEVKKAFGAIARIHSVAPEMTERQRLRLAAFARQYCERTKLSKEYTARHRKALADPRVVNGFRPSTKEIVYQIVMNRSKGSRMWDLDGHEYIDVLNGFGMSLFGWQPDFILEAVRAQMDAGYDIGPQHPVAGEVAELICELTGMDRAGLCNTGSEAVMAAIRIARTVTGRSTLVVFTGSYHGTFDEVLVRAGRGGRGIPAVPGVLPGAFGDVVVLDYGTAEALAYIRENANDLAAVLVEPVQSRRPDFLPREFLLGVRKITEASGTCFIFDEVITGFRSHLGGIQALFGIRADLATYGKVIGGGFPIGVVAGKREYMDALDGGDWAYGDDSMPTVGVTYFAGTFVGHPLALAAAKAALLHLKEKGNALQEELTQKTLALVDELNAHCRDMGAPIVFQSFASLWRLTFTEDHPLQDLVFAMMRSRGIHMLDNFPCFLTTAHSDGDIVAIKRAFRDSLAEMQESEFLPARKLSAVVNALDPAKPPVEGARLGRDKEGNPAWFVQDPQSPGKYIRLVT